MEDKGGNRKIKEVAQAAKEEEKDCSKDKEGLEDYGNSSEETYRYSLAEFKGKGWVATQSDSKAATKQVSIGT